MKSLALLFIIILVSASCNPVKDKQVDQTTIDFKTDDSSKLFFKNVRRNYYDVEVMEEAKLEIYRFKERIIDSDKPAINLSIVNNWRYDEAYVLLEPNEPIGSIQDIKLEWQNEDGTSGVLNFEGGNKTDQLMFASELYKQIQDGSTFWLVSAEDRISLLDDNKSREAFRITMFDYYRLVRSL